MATNASNGSSAPDWAAAQAAVEKGDIGTVRAYLDAGGDVNLQGGSGNMTLLMWAGFTKENDIAALLLERNADVDVVDANCRGTALMWAVEAEAVDIVRQLLAKNPQLDHRDAAGETALMYVAKNGNRQIAKMLLEKGADPAITDLSGQKAIDHARCEKDAQSPTLSQLDVAKVIQEFADKRAAEAAKIEEARQAAQQLTAETVEACRTGTQNAVTLSRKLTFKTPISAR